MTTSYGIIGTSPTSGSMSSIDQGFYNAPGSSTYSISAYKGICEGPDGNVWGAFATPATGSPYGLARTTAAGLVTVISTPVEVGAICAGSDGNVWFAGIAGSNVIGVSTTASPAVVSTFSLTDFPDGGSLTSICLGPDGNIWFSGGAYSDGLGTSQTFGYITPAGDFTYVVTRTGSVAAASAMCLGPDGNVWFCESTYNTWGYCTPGGSVSSFSGSGITVGAVQMCTGSDGRLWFAGADDTVYGLIATTTGGSATAYTDPSLGSTSGTCAGPDGNLWFVGTFSYLGQCSTSGAFALFSIPAGGVYSVVCSGPGDELWFAGAGLVPAPYQPSTTGTARIRQFQFSA